MEMMEEVLSNKRDAECSGRNSVMPNTSRDRAPALVAEHVLELKTYFSLQQIETLSRQWDELLTLAPGNRAFASREWYVASCHKQSSWTPFVTTASLGGRVACILPLVIDHEDETAKFPHHAADYNDAIARTADLSVVADLLSHALASSRPCRRIVLSKLRPDSCCARVFPILFGRSEFQCCWREIDSYRYASLPPSFDAYLNSRSRGFRKHIRRTMRHLEGSGLVIRELHPDTFDPSALPELLIALAVARHGNRCSFTRTAFVQVFLRDTLPSLFRNGHLRAFAMFGGERVLALDLCMVSTMGLATWNGGFLPEVEHYSPGSALFAFEIQQAIESGMHEFDFTRGEEAYKCSWTDSSYTVGELELKT